jgi:hypothetical protein
VSSEIVLGTIKDLVESVRKLEALFPGRRFTLDGHLLGSIGEALAAELYGLKLFPASTRCHHGSCPKGRNVQVKLTQRQQVAMYEEAEHLIVLRLDEESMVEEVYNGPGNEPWRAAGAVQKNGQRSISVNKLRNLSKSVGDDGRITILIMPQWFKSSRSAETVGHNV